MGETVLLLFGYFYPGTGAEVDWQSQSTAQSSTATPVDQKACAWSTGVLKRWRQYIYSEHDSRLFILRLTVPLTVSGTHREWWRRFKVVLCQCTIGIVAMHQWCYANRECILFSCVLNGDLMLISSFWRAGWLVHCHRVCPGVSLRRFPSSVDMDIDIAE